MFTFLKLGGSLITDKLVENTYRADVTERIASEIASALSKDTSLHLLIGHGSGSFGHFAAKKHNTIAGVHSDEAWKGFAEVAAAAHELNYLVLKTLRSRGIPAMAFQPSASCQADNGIIISMAVSPIRDALDRGIVPLVYGDVAFDTVLGGTITSTEKIFFHLAQMLPLRRVILLGEAGGVYDQEGNIIPEIIPSDLPQIDRLLGGSLGVDVTGGMETKVKDMIALVQRIPEITIHIASGSQPGMIERLLLDGEGGTRIHSGS